MEVNFDGLPGPTHNYSGLATGNLASERYRSLASNPRAAALQGLAKMKTLADRGFAQAVLPPHERPDLAALRALGFAGSDAQVLARAAREAPQTLAACSSAAPQFGDEGAANHTRFAVDSETRGIEFFVHGRSGFDTSLPAPKRFAARQTREASEAVARRHGLTPERTLHAQQHPDAIDAGVFHNDVVAVGSGTVLFCHERAYLDQDAVLAALANSIGPAFTPIVVREQEVSLDRAVATYLFNSQLLARRAGGLLLVAPSECAEDASVATLLERLVSSGNAIREVLTFDLKQSMQN